MRTLLTAVCVSIISRHRVLSRRLLTLPHNSCWRAWVESNFLFTLHRAAGLLRTAETIVQAESSVLDRSSGAEQQRKEWQARAYNTLRDAHPDGALHMHLRKRLDRWNIHILPGHRISRATTALFELSRSAPPRMFAEVLRAMCNGWMASRRFQGNGTYCFGCAQEDTMNIMHSAERFTAFLVDTWG
jgi:hypothetical protein